jgi:hypothetical protein
MAMNALWIAILLLVAFLAIAAAVTWYDHR